MKKAARPKKRESPAPEPGERRRSGRSRAVSDYKERADEDDEEEMLDGVAEWDYGNDDDSGSSGQEEQSEEEESEEEQPAKSARAKPAVKAGVLAQSRRGKRSTS